MKRRLEVINKRNLLIFSVGVILLVFVADFYVGKKQESYIREKEEKRRHLEKLAFYMLSVDVRDLRETEDVGVTAQYEAMIRVDNVADEPVYVTQPEVKAYVQTGTISWTEVPVREQRAVETEEEQMPEIEVHKIEPEGRFLNRRMVTISRGIPYNKKLMPLYMHVRFYISLFVLPESGFKEGEVVERRSSVYVYLKPYYVSDEEVREVIDFGDTKVPAYLPITTFRNWDAVGKRAQ